MRVFLGGGAGANIIAALGGAIANAESASKKR